MSRRRKNTFNRKTIKAIVNTPFILLGPTKKARKSAAKKWLDVLMQSSK